MRVVLFSISVQKGNTIPRFVVVKTEEMVEAKPYIEKMLKFTQKTGNDVRHKGRYKKEYSNYFRKLTDDQIEQLKQIYKSDIDLFDYPSSPFL